MGGELYFRHEIDRNPAASDAGKIKAYATMVTYREDMDDSVHTFSFTWSAEDIMEDGGLASKLEEVYVLFVELGYPQEESLEAMIGVLNCDIIQLTSSADYSRDCVLSLWFTFRAPLPIPSTFVHPIEDDDEDDDETTNNNILIKAASKLAVKSQTRKRYNKGGSSPVSDECTICLEEFKDGALLMVLPCGHEFDDECIKDWLATDHICPLCRFELPREYEEN